MARLHVVGGQLAAIGRRALVGILPEMLAAQAVAQGTGTVSRQSPAKAEMASPPNL